MTLRYKLKEEISNVKLHLEALETLLERLEQLEDEAGELIGNTDVSKRMLIDDDGFERHSECNGALRANTICHTIYNTMREVGKPMTARTLEKEDALKQHTKQTISAEVQRLYKAGYVSRKNCGTTKRVRYAYIAAPNVAFTVV